MLLLDGEACIEVPNSLSETLLHRWHHQTSVRHHERDLTAADCPFSYRCTSPNKPFLTALVMVELFCAENLVAKSPKRLSITLFKLPVKLAIDLLTKALTALQEASSKAGFLLADDLQVT